MTHPKKTWSVAVCKISALFHCRSDRKSKCHYEIGFVVSNVQTKDFMVNADIKLNPTLSALPSTRWHARVYHAGIFVPLCKPLYEYDIGNYVGMKGSVSSWMKIGILIDAGEEGQKGWVYTTDGRVKQCSHDNEGRGIHTNTRTHKSVLWEVLLFS